MSNKSGKNEQGNFEFTLYLNKNIVVQRFFNVIGFNKDIIETWDFKEVIDNNKEIIHEHLKNMSIDFMNKYSDYFWDNPSYDQNDSEDFLTMVVKCDGNVIANRTWDARIYPASVRYKVNIKNLIFNLINPIQKCLSDDVSTMERFSTSSFDTQFA
jgi:hypothetical protein